MSESPLTQEQLNALSEYKKHKNCQCLLCVIARTVLGSYDAMPRISGSQTPLQR